MSPHVNTDVEEAPKDFLDQYLLGVKLGRGAFATVRACSKISVNPLQVWDEDAPKNKPDERAVKILDMRTKEKPCEVSQSLQKAAHIEAYCWKACGLHPNCVRLHDLFFGDDFVYMVMEKCQSGLLHALESMPEFTERGVGNIAAQMLLGIAHCHSQKVVHRDIKPDNFLVGGEDGVIKLADFGLSAMLPKQGKLPGVFGTAPFMCPEMLRDRSYDEKADVWSFGVVVYVLLYGQFPYMPKKPSAQAMKQLIISGETAPCHEPIQKPGADPRSHALFRSPDAVNLVKTVLNRDSEKRPSAEEVMHMPYLTAAMNGTHMTSSDLPSLRPMLHGAKKCGAFEVRDPARETQADDRLNKLQVERHGKDLPETPSAKRQAEAGAVGKTLSNSSNFELKVPHSSKGLWENSSNRSTNAGDSSNSTPRTSFSTGDNSPPTSRSPSH